MMLSKCWLHGDWLHGEIVLTERRQSRKEGSIEVIKDISVTLPTLNKKHYSESEIEGVKRDSSFSHNNIK